MDRGWHTSLEITVCNLTKYILSYAQLNSYINFCAGESGQDGLHFLVLHDCTVVLLHGESIGRTSCLQFVQGHCDASIILVCALNVIISLWVLFVLRRASAIRKAPRCTRTWSAYFRCFSSAVIEGCLMWDCVLGHLLTYLLTYLLHGAQSFLRS
jgi:hypothetical protein